MEGRLGGECWTETEGRRGGRGRVFVGVFEVWEGEAFEDEEGGRKGEERG